MLPEKLINPTRFALDNPDGYEPEILATYLQTAAQAGSRDVDRFKKDWHSDDVRELWNDVSTNDLPQGGDAWVMDYDLLLQNSGKNDHAAALVNGTSHLPQHLTDEDTTEVVNAFRAKHPEMQVHMFPQASPPSLDLTMDQLGFHLEQDVSSGSIGYKVSRKANSGAPDLVQAIVESIQTDETKVGLAILLVCPSNALDTSELTCYRKCSPLITMSSLDPATNAASSLPTNWIYQ